MGYFFIADFIFYLGVIFDTSGTDDKETRSRVIQAKKMNSMSKRNTVE